MVHQPNRSELESSLGHSSAKNSGFCVPRCVQASQLGAVPLKTTKLKSHNSNKYLSCLTAGLAWKGAPLRTSTRT